MLCVIKQKVLTITKNDNKRNEGENLNDKFIEALMNPTRQRIIGYLNFIADIFDTSAEQRTEKIEKYMQVILK